MAEKEDHVFFVKVREANGVKRNLLESLRDIVESLQRFEKFKSIREEKHKNMDKLRENVKELIKLNSKLKSAMPDTKLRIALDRVKEVNKKRPKPKIKVGKKIKLSEVNKEVEPIKVEKPKPITELEKLESELSEIENRLGSLN